MNNSFLLKRAYAQAFAVFVAVIIGHWVAFSESYWMVIAAVVVMQTMIGVNLRQGLQQFLFLLVTVIVGTEAALWLPFNSVLFFGAILLCFGAVYGMRLFIFSVVLFIALMTPTHSPDILHARVYDLIIGAVIGILTNLFIFPVRPDVAFRQAMLLMLKFYRHTLDSLQAVLFKKSASDALLKPIDTRMFPQWVYQSGLSTTLQPGYRHFLSMMERVGELFASLHRSACHSFDPELLTSLEEPFQQFMTEANKIFQALSVVLMLNKLNEPVGDLKEEWLNLEKAINSLLPASFEAIEENLDYLLLLSLREDVKDLRYTLISLGNSLQTACATLT